MLINLKKQKQLTYEMCVNYPKKVKIRELSNKIYTFLKIIVRIKYHI